MEEVERRPILKASPKSEKEISLNDGRQYRVRGRGGWLTGPCLVILDKGDLVHITYRNIASIKILEIETQR
ncbi:MAG: hypothetical protein HYY16_06610 [Planctomycetes bacterium]|nr:hypothetical protein [Planctomycetota bacterium]